MPSAGYTMPVSSDTVKVAKCSMMYVGAASFDPLLTSFARPSVKIFLIGVIGNHSGAAFKRNLDVDSPTCGVAIGMDAAASLVRHDESVLFSSYACNIRKKIKNKNPWMGTVILCHTGHQVPLNK